MLFARAFAAAFLVPAFLAAQPAAPLRVVEPLHRDWTFQYFPAEAPDPSRAAPGFNDSAWQAVALPHTWSTHETTAGLHPFQFSPTERHDAYWWQGWGWYRKRFSHDARAKGKRISLEFDGVQKYCRVYVNGKPAGEHRGGYTGFSLDITSHVRPGVNVLAVEVSNRRDGEFAAIPPGQVRDFNVYGGIYREARIVFRDPLHIPFQGNAGHQGGVFITTPKVAPTVIQADVRTWVRNDHPAPRRAILRTILLDPEGKELDRVDTPREIPAGALVELGVRFSPTPNPRLWSPDHPWQYRVVSTVIDEAANTPTDSVTTPFGFRWYTWDAANRTLTLNGKPIDLRAAVRHQDYPWLGDAVPRFIHAWDLRTIRRDLGWNALRTPYPQDTLVYDQADSFGLVTVVGLPRPGAAPSGPDPAEQNVREMIRRLRNHPAIFFWDVSSLSPAAAEWVRQEDPSRLQIRLPLDPPPPALLHTVRGWYDFHDIPAFEGKPDRGQHGPSAAGVEARQYQAVRQPDPAAGPAPMSAPWSEWTLTDHGSALDDVPDSPLRRIDWRGWLDGYRVPKYVYHLSAARFSERPTLFVQGHHWRRSNIGQVRPVLVESNCDEVTIKIGGRVFDRRRPAAGSGPLVFGLPVSDALLTVEASKDGITFVHHVPLLGEPARLQLTASHPALVADRAGLSVLTVQAADSAGNAVIGARPDLTWTIKGPGRLLGPEQYQSDSARDGQTRGVGYIDLPVANIVRSTAAAGIIEVTVSAPGLAPATLQIVSEAPVRVDGWTAQPALSDAGRNPVRRQPGYRQPLSIRGVDEISEIDAPVPLQAPLAAQARQAFDSFVAARHPRVDRTSSTYWVLAERMALSMAAHKGHLLPEEFNPAVRHYHAARGLQQYLLSLGLPGGISTYLTEAFAQQPEEVDLPYLRARFSQLGSDYIVFYAEDADRERVRYFPAAPTGSVLQYRADSNRVNAILEVLYPEYRNLENSDRLKILHFLDDINPGMRFEGDRQSTGACKIIPSQPVLIPAWKALEKIVAR